MLPTLSETAARLRRRELSARELVEWQLRQIELLDPKLHAFVSLRPEQALREAERLDAGPPAGPLHGIPLAIKDNIELEGSPTSAGSPLLGSAPARRDAEAVARLRAAGAIVIGKNALYELAFGAQNERWPAPENPWRLARATAGSSSGSAAAVAAGLAFAALASDTGGSIRVPAAFCGLLGLRPGAGTIPREGLVRLSRLDELGPLTRCAADAALMFRVLGGRGENGGETGAARHPVAGLRLGVSTQAPDDPALSGPLEAFCATLHELGASPGTPHELDFAAAAAALWTIAGAEAAERWFALARARPGLVHPVVMERLAAGKQVSAAELAQANARAARLTAELVALFETLDVLVLPAAGCSGYPLGARSLELGGRSLEVSALVTRYTPLASLAGLPALVLPCGVDGEGMPVGVQLIAAAGNDELLLELACAYQAVTSWHERMPGVAASFPP